MSFHIKYRPTLFKNFFGNEELKKSLLSLIQQKDKPKTYLLTGPSGSGKTTLARILAKKFGAEDNSIIELNAADTRGIDTVRSIISDCQFKHITGSDKVFIFDEVHQMSRDGMEALLKVIEEPPSHVYFFFCSTNPDRIIETIKNRCIRYEVKLLNDSEANILLDYVINMEKLDIDNKVKGVLIKYSDGCPRKLLLNLYKCKDLSLNQTINILESSIDGVKEEVINLCKKFLNPKELNWKNMMDTVSNLIKEDNADSIRISFYTYMSACLKRARTDEQVMVYSAILDVLDQQLQTGGVGNAALVHLLGRIYIGLKS